MPIVSTGALPLRAPEEHLTEVRVKLQLPVRVWGMDTNGKPFSVSAETIDISGLGARLRGVPNLQDGDIVGIQYANQKARCRVVWIGQPGTPRAEEIGVESLEGSACIWAAALEQHEIETANRGTAGPNPLAAASTSSGAAERRRYPRYQCRGDVEVRTASTRTATRVTLTDISLGGCYAETLSPLPVNTPVDLALRVAGIRISIKGVVRTSHSAMGMGIGFLPGDPEQRLQLAHMVNEVDSPAIAAEPQLSVPAPPPVSLEAGVDVLVRLLEKRGLISREEFLAELLKHDPSAAKQPSVAS
jgi:hypothetical protein